MKNKISKRIASVFLCLIVVLTTINLPKFTMEVKAAPAPGVRNSGTCGTTVYWTLYDNGQLVISGSGDMDDYIAGSAPWYPYFNNINDVVIQSGVTSIGTSAFDDCRRISSVSLPSGITKIGDGAFSKCESLTNIDIPSGVISIGFAAFESSGLTSITIPSGITIIESDTFSRCTNLTSISLPNGLTTIGVSAFSNCSALSSIEIPATVTLIRSISFQGCDALNEVIFKGSTPPTLSGSYIQQNASRIIVPDGKISDYEDAGLSNLIEESQAVPPAAPPVVPPTAPGNSSSKSSSNSDSNKAHSHSLSWVVTKEPTVNSDGASSLVCSSCGHVESTQTISRAAVVYTDVANKFEANLRNIELQPGKKALLELGDWHSVPSYLMERVIKSNVDVEITYKYQGKNYDIIVPAGKGIDLNIPWYGPLLMNALYGEK